jgi:hypothetical protein
MGRKRTSRWFEKNPTAARDYDDAVERARYALGSDGKMASFDTVAQHLYAATGETVAGQTIRRWFRNRSIPLHWACSLVDVTEGAVHVFEFFPYLPPYAQGSPQKDFLD